MSSMMIVPNIRDILSINNPALYPPLNKPNRYVNRCPLDHSLEVKWRREREKERERKGGRE